MLRKLFRRRTAKEEISISPDNKICGNTSELFKSIHDDVIDSTIKVLYPDINVDELSEEELEDLLELGYVLYLLGCGFHASAEDIERLEKDIEQLEKDGHLQTP